jgi:hypothetical protein
LALALFAGTGFALILAPQVTLAVLAVTLSAGLIEGARRRWRASVLREE